MEILRTRLLESEYSNHHGITFLNMPKSRAGRRAGESLPCKAKRRLFQDDPPAGVENSQAQANLRTNISNTNSHNSSPCESEKLQERYTDIEVFENAPSPYRPVHHSAEARNGLDSTRKLRSEDENIKRPAGSGPESSSSAPEKQSRLPDYFKPKKRARTSSPPQKSPEEQLRNPRPRRAISDKR